MRALFVTWFGGGNVNPVLATAKDFIKLGGQSIILSNPAFEEKVKRNSVPFRPFRGIAYHDPASPKTDQIRAYEGSTVAEANAIIGHRLVVDPAPKVLENTLQAIDDFHPDVLMVDYTLPGAMAAAESLNIPFFVAADGVYPLPYKGRSDNACLYAYLFKRMLEPQMNEKSELSQLRSSIGLEPFRSIDNYLAAAHEVLIMTYEQLNRFKNPPKTSFVGPQFAPPKNIDFEKKSELIFGAFSTITTPEQDIFIDRLVTALSELGKKALIATGATPHRQFPSIMIKKFVDFSTILPQRPIMINHAGNGTVVRAVSHGVPQIATPFIQDQYETAITLDELRVAIRLEKVASVEIIKETLMRAIGDNGLAERSADLAREITRMHQPMIAAKKMKAALS